MDLRTAAMGLSPAKNLRAVSFSICWLSLSPNCIFVLLCITSTQHSVPEHFFLPQRSLRVAKKKKARIRPAILYAQGFKSLSSKSFLYSFARFASSRLTALLNADCYLLITFRQPQHK